MWLTLILNYFTAWPRVLAVLALACGGALATALVSQYAFGAEPCVLCILQRWPLALAFALSLAGLVLQIGGHTVRRRARVLLLGVAALALLAAAALAFFHTGVEQHWWAGTAGCTIDHAGAADAAALREQLLARITARCDEISWTFLGFSMANWNMPFSLALSTLAVLAARRARREKFK
ncbi:MAG: disulfide bond formation protein B [Alphaproteobacteria bacterium]|nr:disulfide bond formation protein B [Alphaproteobacteria bacterium]